MSILVTGFGPFPGVPRNPSQLVVERFPDKLGGHEIHRVVIPTIYDEAATTIESLLVGTRPDICLCLGVAGDPFLRLETVARNHGTVPMPDESGIIRSGPIAPAGPDTYPCTLPFTTIHPVLKKRGVAVELSDDAGGYVCNHVSYTARHAIERHGLATACGFVHVPPIRSVDREGEEIEGLIRDVQTIVELLVEEVQHATDRQSSAIRESRSSVGRMELSEFEKRLLDALVETSGPQGALLREQLSTATDRDREFTGAGYFLNFTIPSSAPRLPPGRYPVGDIRFELEGIENGGGALLWVEDGLLASLEVYLHGGEGWPAEPRLTQLATLEHDKMRSPDLLSEPSSGSLPKSRG